MYVINMLFLLYALFFTFSEKKKKKLWGPKFQKARGVIMMRIFSTFSLFLLFNYSFFIRLFIPC